MSVLKASAETTTRYSFKPEQIKQLIAFDLGVSEEKVDVHFVIREVGGCEYSGFRGTDKVTEIQVTVRD